MSEIHWRNCVPWYYNFFLYSEGFIRGSTLRSRNILRTTIIAVRLDTRLSPVDLATENGVPNRFYNWSCITRGLENFEVNCLPGKSKPHILRFLVVLTDRTYTHRDRVSTRTIHIFLFRRFCTLSRRTQKVFGVESCQESFLSRYKGDTEDLCELRGIRDLPLDLTSSSPGAWW